MNTQLYTLAAIAILFSEAGAAIGQTYSHVGTNNPTTEGFTLYTWSASEIGATNDLGLDSLYIKQTTPSIVSYYCTLPSSIDSSDWTVSFTLRSTSGYGAFVTIYTGDTLFGIDFYHNAKGNLVVNNYTLSTAASTIFNDYKLVYDSSTQTVDLYADGVEVIDNITGAESSNSACLAWGSATQDASMSEWSSINLTAVPEPSTVSLFLLGAGAVFYARRKHMPR